MAKAQLTPILPGLHGKLAGVVIKHYGDKVVVSRRPDMRRVKPTAAQREQRKRFAAAARYYRARVKAQPELYALYAEFAAARGRLVHSVAIADYLHPPVIDEIDLSAYAGWPGDPIFVRAHDDFMVASVHVSIHGPDGYVEDGQAVCEPDRDEAWWYRARAELPAGTPVRVTVTVYDHPRNQDVRDLEWTVGAEAG